MSLFFYLNLYILLFLNTVDNVDISILNFLFNNTDYITLIWAVIILLLIINFRNSNKSTTSALLYVFGIWQSLTKKPIPTLSLCLKNLTTTIYFYIYNVKDFILFLPKNQIWVPLFKRGGYIFLLNSMRTRWQLSKTNSIFKNK